MAKRVEGVTEQLLNAAKQEFLEKGYENASLRTIAERAGSSKGAIYIRYRDKADLYRAVVEPTIDRFCEQLQGALQGFMDLPGEEQSRSMNSYSDQGMDFLLNGLYAEYDVFKILVSSGEMDAYHDFIHRVVALDNACTEQFIQATGNDAFSSGRLTPDLMHILSNAFYMGLMEIVVHDMPEEDALSHLKNLRAFYNVGWHTVFFGESSAAEDAAVGESNLADTTTCLVDEQGWVRCPVCEAKTRTKILPETTLYHFPLYCPKCRQTTVVSRGGP